MLLQLEITVNRAAFDLEAQGWSEARAIEEANKLLAEESKKNFGLGRVTVGKLPDGRFFFRHLALGNMVKVPEKFELEAVKKLKHSIIPAVKLTPTAGAEFVGFVHGIWARQSWVDEFCALERVTFDVESRPVLEREVA